MDNELLATYTFRGRKIDVYGCIGNDTPEGEFEFYDLYDHETGICLNEGDPWYPGEWSVTPIAPPTEEEVTACLEGYLEINEDLFGEPV